MNLQETESVTLRSHRTMAFIQVVLRFGSVNLSNHLFIMIISKKIEPIDNVL